MVRKALLFIFVIAGMYSCKEAPKPAETIATGSELDSAVTDRIKPLTDSVDQPKDLITPIVVDTSMDDTAFIDLSLLDPNILLQFHYADTTNFLKTKVYPCATCYLRYEVAKALVKVNIGLREKGLQLVFFDCYRPRDVQKLMWEVVPDARYVATPYKGSSKHNRGGAVDITLADTDGNVLDMGTGFDHFGKEAHHDYQELPFDVLENRVTLKEAMALEGFSPITTEWWHYNYKNSGNYEVSNQALPCP